VRFIVFGAGAIGGVLGARLYQSGREVVLVARGPHLDAIQRGGLRLRDPEGEATLPIEAVGGAAQAAIGREDVVLLAVKTQDSEAALAALRAAAPPETAIVCAQNGVASESMAARDFSRVYGMMVMCPTAYLEPGVVCAYSSPVTGVLDVGPYPDGHDAEATALAAALRDSGFDSEVRADIMRWKYGKLLDNLGNALEALAGPAARRGSIGQRARAEGIACLTAAGIAYTEPRRDALRPRPIAGEKRGGGSTWQSLARATGSVESDYLNGEIVSLGVRHGVATPVNQLLQQLARECAQKRIPPGSFTEPEILQRLA
jgi:2-dehydropantoate 2-reductase